MILHYARSVAKLRSPYTMQHTTPLPYIVNQCRWSRLYCQPVSMVEPFVLKSISSDMPLLTYTTATYFSGRSPQSSSTRKQLSVRLTKLLTGHFSLFNDLAKAATVFSSLGRGACHLAARDLRADWCKKWAGPLAARAHVAEIQKNMEYCLHQPILVQN